MEYFWGWDQSGGTSGNTGVKSSDKIESVTPKRRALEGRRFLTYSQ